MRGIIDNGTRPMHWKHRTEKNRMKNKNYREYKICCCCGTKLTKSKVLGGFMGILFNLIFFWDNSWKDMFTCQECRDMYAVGYSAEEIIALRRGHNKC